MKYMLFLNGKIQWYEKFKIIHISIVVMSRNTLWCILRVQFNMNYTTTCIVFGFYHLRGKSLWYDININTSSYIYWRGYTNAKEQASAFRQCFSKLGELWLLVPNNTPMLALTVTASSQTIASVTKYLFVLTWRKSI